MDTNTVPNRCAHSTRNKLLSLLGVFLCIALAIGICGIPASASAADSTKPDEVKMQIGGDSKTINVAKDVATLDSTKGSTELKFNVSDSYKSAKGLERELLLRDAKGNETSLKKASGNELKISIKEIKDGSKLYLRTKADGKERYKHLLNVRLADTKKASEQSNWQLANGGFSYTFKNSSFKFLNGTTISLSAIRLPVTYKHNPDGTTIVGLNCNADDMSFYKAVKNKNVWQKYSTDAVLKKIKEIDKGWDGKKLGKFGSKGMDWSLVGYGEFNTKDPSAPWTITVMGHISIKLDGHAQYLIFTGTLTATAGGKFTGSLSYAPKTSSFSGSLDIGALGSLELYIGVGCNYVASIGAYGKATIDADFGLIPTNKSGLKAVYLRGEAGAKAKAFGYTVATWKIIASKEPFYLYKRDKKSPLARLQAAADGEPADSLSEVRSDVAYPQASRDYLLKGSTWTGNQPQQAAAASQEDLTKAAQEKLSAQNTAGGLTAAGAVKKASNMAAQATSLITNVYSGTQLVCANTSQGPVVAYIADADQVSDIQGRNDQNRTVLVYSRYQDGAWTPPRAVDALVSDTQSTAGAATPYSSSADYSPAIYASPDSNKFYLAWLDAKELYSADDDTLGEVAQKLDVRYAQVDADNNVTLKTVAKTSADTETCPATPAVFTHNNKAYVAWATNKITGTSGEVMGMSGPHQIALAEEVDTDAVWPATKSTTGNGAITSFSAGMMGTTPACAWSLDTDYAKNSAADSEGINAEDSLESSTVYKMDWVESNANGTQTPVAPHATNAQFVKEGNNPVLTYATWAEGAEGGDFYSIYSTANGSDSTLRLDGTSVELPTPHYSIVGNISGAANTSMVAFLQTDDGTDIHGLVSKGTGADEWSSQVEATDQPDNITSFAGTYVGNEPLFVYATETDTSLSGQSATAANLLGAQASGGDSANLYASTNTSLQRVSIDNVDYDEMEVQSGDIMPITVDFTNRGITPVDGVDIYLYNAATGDVITQNYSDSLQPGDSGTLSFDIQLPDVSALGNEVSYMMLAVPKGVAVTTDMIQQDGDANVKFNIGEPHLTLEADHQVIDGQERIHVVATNEGMTESKPATMVFEESSEGLQLNSVEVPALGENETFEYDYDAPEQFFQNTNVYNMRIYMVDENDQEDLYSLYNTDGVYTWDVDEPENNKAMAPKTGDAIDWRWISILAALAVLAAGTTAYAVYRKRAHK